MRLFDGLQKTDYQDVLRAIGLLMDQRGYRNFRLIEHENGIIIQAMPTVDGRIASHYQTFLLTDEDLNQALQKSYRHRETLACEVCGHVLRTGDHSPDLAGSLITSVPLGKALMRGGRKA